jgi:hypothetical protein
MSLALYLIIYLLLNMFRMLVHPSSGACDFFVDLLLNMFRILVLPSSGACEFFEDLLLWFDVCWCYGVARLGWCVILL